MTLFHRRQLKTFARLVWGAVAVVVILFAVCVQLGRLVFPNLNDYKTVIEDSLSARLNATIKVGSIVATWDGLRPSLMLNQVSISGGEQAGELYAEHLSAEFSLLATLSDWRLALDKLNFEGLRAELIQADSGLWKVAGLPKSSDTNNNFTIDDPLDIFLFGRRLELKETTLSFTFRTGHVAAMTIPSVTLENDANFHRLKANLGVDDDNNAFRLVVEGRGDPRNDAEFIAKGFLQLEQFPLQKVVAATGLQKGLDIKPGLWSDGSRMDMQLWFQGSMPKGLFFSGWAKANGLPFDLPANAVAPSIPPFKYTGRWHKDKGFVSKISQLGLSWPQASAPPLDIELRASTGAGVEARVRELDVTAWAQVFEALNITGPASKLYSSLKPKGLLRNIGIKLTTPQEGYFTLKADVIDGAVESWQGAPEIHHAAGYVELSATQGRMVIAANDGFVMHYPMVYKKPLRFDRASGEVAWFIDLPEKMVYVTSGLLHLKGESGEGAGYLYLSLPTVHKDNVEPEMTLVVGMRESFAQYHDTFIPFTIPDSLYNWLHQSIKEGELTDGGFIFRGSLLGHALRPRSLQLSMKVHSGELAFDPHWPLLTQADATVLVDDMTVKIAIENGDLLGNRLSNGRVSLTHTSKNKPALRITGDASGNTSDALALLQQSPINAIAGEALAQLKADGRYKSSINLLVPLEGNLADGRQDIRTSIESGSLSLPAIGLEFSDLSGDIRYQTREGLQIPKITATLWNKPVKGSLATLNDPQGRILKLDFAVPNVAVADLKKWLKQPFLEVMEGSADAKGWLKLPFDHPKQGVELEITTALKGVAIQVPAPYGKLAKDKAPTVVRYLLPRASDLSQIQLHSQLTKDNATNTLDMDLRQRAGHMVALDIGLNQAATAAEGNVRLHGNLEQLDAKAWWATIEAYQAAQASTREEPSGLVNPLLSMAINANNVTFGEFALANVQASVKQLPEALYCTVNTPEVLADYKRFNDGRPSQVDIKYLHLPPADPSKTHQQKASVLADAALEHLEALDVNVDELSVGAKTLGSIAFNYRPQHKGLVAKNLRGTLVGVTTQDATLALYKQSENAWETSLNGKFEAANLGDVMANLDLPRVISSQQAEATISLNWPGYPDQLAVDHLTGTVDLDLKNGVFVQDQKTGDTALLNLLALLNFDTLVRRLQLDFTDLSSKGLVYDRVHGRLMFNRNIVTLPKETPLVVDASSADLQLTGTLNIAEQSIDSRLMATLPLAGNVATAAALIAGLPAALGVYVVSKLFKKQVESLGSVRYSVKGKWSDPDITVDNIFKVAARAKPVAESDKPATSPTDHPSITPQNP